MDKHTQFFASVSMPHFEHLEGRQVIKARNIDAEWPCESWEAAEAEAQRMADLNGWPFYGWAIERDVAQPDSAARPLVRIASFRSRTAPRS